MGAIDKLEEDGSVHLVHGKLRLLLDFGQSDAFAKNADALGIDLTQVDAAVLSHALPGHVHALRPGLAFML